MAKEIKNILVIRFRRVGDAVISATLCSSLKKSFPQAQVHYVLSEEVAPLFTPHPDIDKVITITKATQKSFLSYLCCVRKIMKDTSYDLIIDTRSTVKTLFFSLFSLSTPWRIGRKKYYNKWIQNYRIPLHTHDEITNTLVLLDPLESQYAVTKDRVLHLQALPQERKLFGEKMKKLGVRLTDPIVVCAVTARLEHKVWKREYMKEVISRILDHYPTAQLIFNYGNERERTNAQSLYQELGCPQRVFIDLSADTLREVVAMLSYASFFFGNEGGPRHISQALNVHSFAIYPPNISKQVWLPSSNNYFQGIEPADVDYIKAHSEELTYEQKFDLINAEEVWKRLNPMLEKALCAKD